MKKNENSYKKSGVNISLANKLVKHISKISQKNDQKSKGFLKKDVIGGFGSLFDLSNTKIKDMVNESLSSWLKTNDQKDQLVFDFSQGSAQLSRFFQNQELESSPGGRKIISPVIKDGQLRWANDPRPISFPYMQELDLWHIKGLRVLGRPDLELRVAEDPDNPGSRWRIGLSVGLARPPQIEILKDGTPIQVEIESHKVTAPVREGVDLELILEKLPLQEINRVQYRLIVQPLGTQDPPSLATIFSIPAGSIPSGAPQLRCEGDITGWNTKINFMKLSGKLDRDRILRDGSSRSSP